MSRRIVVTGATGFLGQHVVERLRAGGAEVIGTSRSGGRGFVAADVLDAEALREAMRDADVVVHAAGDVSHHPDDAEWMHRVHVRGTENAVTAARDVGVKRFVHLSTSGTVAVSTKGDAVHDEHAPAPLGIISAWPYYRAKYFAEQVALSAEGIEVISLNPSLLLGPGDHKGGSVRSVRLFLEDRVPGIPPGGLSFVDVRDVANAVALAVEGGRPGHRYLLAGANMTFAAFYGRLARLTGKPAPALTLPETTRKVLEWLPSWGRKGGIGLTTKVDRHDLEFACHTWFCDTRKARAELGWSSRDPQLTLEDTVRHLVAGA